MFRFTSQIVGSASPVSKMTALSTTTTNQLPVAVVASHALSAFADHISRCLAVPSPSTSAAAQAPSGPSAASLLKWFVEEYDRALAHRLLTDTSDVHILLDVGAPQSTTPSPNRKDTPTPCVSVSVSQFPPFFRLWTRASAERDARVLPGRLSESDMDMLSCIADSLSLALPPRSGDLPPPPAARAAPTHGGSVAAAVLPAESVLHLLWFWHRGGGSGGSPPTEMTKLDSSQHDLARFLHREGVVWFRRWISQKRIIVLQRTTMINFPARVAAAFTLWRSRRGNPTSGPFGSKMSSECTKRLAKEKRLREMDPSCQDTTADVFFATVQRTMEGSYVSYSGGGNASVRPSTACNTLLSSSTTKPTALTTCSHQASLPQKKQPSGKVAVTKQAVRPVAGRGGRGAAACRPRSGRGATGGRGKSRGLQRRRRAASDSDESSASSEDDSDDDSSTDDDSDASSSSSDIDPIREIVQRHAAERRERASRHSA